MKDRESLVWIKAKAKKQSFRIIILSIANIILALIGTGLSVLSKFAIDAAQMQQMRRDTLNLLNLETRL